MPMVKHMNFKLSNLTIFSFIFSSILSISFCKSIDDKFDKNKISGYTIINEEPTNLPKTTNNTSLDFIKSFINHYDFKVESRYTHEYHNHLLNKTSQSFAVLENELLNENFNICGRIIVAGYEGEAFPSYYTNYKKAKINDETTSHNKFGWSQRLHNKFGFMTGFLFKDLNQYLNDTNSIYQHINPQNIELFTIDSELFLQHSFGSCYNMVIDYKNLLEKNLKNSQYKILKILKSFWTELYNSESQTSENQIAATQDILFSIEYANYLLNSNLPFLKYYTGPDITYPIETSVVQEKEATKNSQDFIPIFISNLKPINNLPTVYIFDSFVDGVGKSTMLGNVKNWINNGANIDKYERVDNSSSQFADIFKFNDKVFIADLPAQVSHFTYKPDGFVYVSIETEMNNIEIQQTINFAKANKTEMLQFFFQKVANITQIIQNRGPLDDFFTNTNDPQDLFVRNLIVLKKMEDNVWIPFSIDDNNFIVNAYNLNQVKILKPIGKVSSYGLKNVDPEQMLFTKVNFPAAYENFLSDLTSKLKTNNIKNIVFVDFLSMYPRSSRENIRINYLLFQLSLIDSSFKTENSFYKNFISGAQLYADITSKDVSPFMLNHFQLEIALRLILFKLIDEDKTNLFKEIKISDLSTELKKQILEITKNNELINYIEKKSEYKLSIEQEKLKKTFGKSKEYLSIWQFSFELLEVFSNKIKNLFKNEINCPELNQLWSDLDGHIQTQNEFYDGEINKPLKLTNNQDVMALFEFHPKFRTETYLTPFFQKLRAAWYTTFSNLLNCKRNNNNELEIETVKYKIIPFLLKSEKNGDFYLIQKLLPPWTEDKINLNTTKSFNLNIKQSYFEFLQQPYLAQFATPETNNGIYAFDYDAKQKTSTLKQNKNSVITKIVKEFQQEYGPQSAISTSELYGKLLENAEWKIEQAFLKQQAIKNSKQNQAPNKSYCRLAKTEEIEGARLFIISIATLEMLLKDPTSDIVVRKGNKKDFIAAIKLLEHITLPKYFKILFQAPLFEDYKNISPLISWEYFEN